MNCRYCFGHCVKAGFCKSSAQKLRCKSCGKYQLAVYANKAYQPEINKELYKLHCEGVGIRGIARVLGISTATVMTRIKILGDIAERQKPGVKAYHKILEIDENVDIHWQEGE
jgi:insertion element IS1 protein InsB